MKLHKTKNDLAEKTRRKMIDLLNQNLADALDLHLQGKQAHWAEPRELFMNSGDTFGAIDSGVTVGHVHLKVADLERALSFYRGVLGFQLTQRMGDNAAFLSAGGYHHHIGLNNSSRRRTPAASRWRSPPSWARPASLLRRFAPPRT